MSYETGTLVWGASKSIGNVWIVTDGPGRGIRLLFDGKNQRFCPDENLTKFDTIKPTSFLYELTTLEISVLMSKDVLPQWAADFMALRPNPLLPQLPKTTLPPAVVLKVQKLLNVNLTPAAPSVILRKDETCPVSGADHKFTAYTGLIQSFEFCAHCDLKRDIKREER